jgi:integrase/recombinase XerD
MGHLTGDEVKALLAEPDPTTRRGLRDTVLLSTSTTPPPASRRSAT